MLLKVMWGKNIQSIGVTMPNALKRLLNRSPKLRTLNYNKVYMQKNDDDVFSLNIENRATGIQRVGLNAKRNGTNSAVSYINRLLKIKEKQLYRKYGEI